MYTRRRWVAALAGAVLTLMLTGAAVARSDSVNRCLEESKTEEERQACRWRDRGNG